MFKLAGEDVDGAGYRCPGEGECQRWDAQKGDTYDEKVTCCKQCPNKCTPPPRPEQKQAVDAEDAAAAELVDTIEYLVAWENAGRPTDWDEYTYEHQKLYMIWRDAERDVELLQTWRHQEFLKFNQALMLANNNATG